MDRSHPVVGWLGNMLARYRAYAVGLTTMALLVLVRKLVLDSYSGNQLSLRLFIVPVIAAAWSGGLRPGLLMALVSVIAAPLLFSELGNGAIDWPTTVIFVTVSIVVSGFMESLHVTRRRLEGRQRQLEFEMGERQKLEETEKSHSQRLFQEIEQRKVAEAGLREREERIRMAVESANIGTWDLNVLTGERKWSARAKSMFGLTDDVDVNRLSFTELLHPDDRERTSRAIRQALDPSGDGRYEAEYRAQWSDGTLRWIIAKGQAFFLGEGAQRQAVRFLGTVFDFSDRKELEQALRDADRRKDEFLATLAHELRNPLAPISYALQLWPTVESDATASAELRAMMHRQVDHITRLIDDLMDVSRITQGKIELRRQQADLRTIVNGAIESMQSVIQSSGHQLTVTLPNHSVLVEADVARLTQVFANILNNAAKYTTRNGVIWVSVSAHEQSATVSIRDNGPGIPEHMLKDIFELFHQVDNSTSRAHGGLGIGLTLVKQLVELHGGTVEAQSDGLGKGAEFLVTLPARIEIAPDASMNRPHFHMQQYSVLPPRRILVVDDIDPSAQMLAMLLRAMGQLVVAVNEGQAAIDWVRSHRPDAVFLDIAMPGMNGYDVARSVRALPECDGTVLIALTGYGQEEDRQRAFEAGFDHHLVKPANVESLEQILRAVPSPVRETAKSGEAAD
jgi:PAS domain S-box-containing protein